MSQVIHNRTAKLLMNIRWGLRVSFGFAIVCGLFAAIARIFGGTAVFRNLFTLQQLLLSYLVLALASGLMLGLLRPIMRTLSGAALTGAVIGLLLAGEVRTFVLGAGPLEHFDIELLLFLGISGVIGGFFWRRGISQLEEQER